MKRLALFLFLTNLAGCITVPKIKIPAKDLDIVSYNINIPCPLKESHVFVSKCKLHVSKNGFMCVKPELVACEKGQKGFILWGFDLDGYSEIDAHFQYLYQL